MVHDFFMLAIYIWLSIPHPPNFKTNRSVVIYVMQTEIVVFVVVYRILSNVSENVNSNFQR